MKIFPIAILLIIGVASTSSGQEMPDFFDSDEILEVKMKFSVKEMKYETNDSTYLDSYFYYKDEKGTWDSVFVDLRARGNFRRDNCYYPPIRMKVKKKNAKGSILEGHKNFKIVLPCAKSKSADAYLVKEYLCYQLFEEVSEYTFSTRMVKISLEDQDSKNGEPEELMGFLIEHDDDVADRFGGEILKEVKIAPTFMVDTATVRHDFFQMMIGNTDWSSLFRHNEKVLKLDQQRVVPLAYDFDMTGLVNPPYAKTSDIEGQEVITDRVFRGFCRDEALMEHVRQEFLAKESEIIHELVRFESMLPSAHLKMANSYLEEFFAMLKNDRMFRSKVMDACRKA